MSEHTPGPWEIAPHSDADERLDIVSEYETVDTDSGIIQRAHWIAELDAATDPELSDSENESSLETMHANARLIAAAPELLEACKAVEAHHVELNARIGRDESDSATLRIVRAAIARAEGRS